MESVADNVLEHTVIDFLGASATFSASKPTFTYLQNSLAK